MICIHVVTLFPEMFQSIMRFGVSGRAWKMGQFELLLWNPRDFTKDPYRRIDDRPYGGGPGMVMLLEPLARTIEAIFSLERRHVNRPKVILMSPLGKRMTHAWFVDELQSLQQERDCVIVCGRYEAIDQRFIDAYVDEQLSLGDFVMSGGEIAAMAVIDALIRLLPGVLNDPLSHAQDSFVNGLLDCPHYTRPAHSSLGDVPPILLTGHHADINAWRRRQSLLLTRRYRPDLIDILIRNNQLSVNDHNWLENCDSQSKEES